MAKPTNETLSVLLDAVDTLNGLLLEAAFNLRDPQAARAALSRVANDLRQLREVQ